MPVGIGRIHVAVNVPSFTSFTYVDNANGTVNVSWTTVRASSVTITRGPGNTFVGSGGASGTINNVNIGYGTTMVFYGSASDTAGGTASAQLTAYAAIGPAPVFTSATASVASRNITLTWVATNCTVVQVYQNTGTGYTLLATSTNSNSYVFAAPSYSTVYNFLLRAVGTLGASNTDTTLSATTGTLPRGTANFAWTAGAQAFSVPQGVYSIDVTMWAGNGSGGQGGKGGLVQCSLAVNPGESLDILVGGSGAHGGTFGGGGGGFAGGGGSFVQRSGTKLAVAGGGGGQGGPGFVNDYDGGHFYYADGGHGGGYDGGSFAVAYGGRAASTYGPGPGGTSYIFTISPLVQTDAGFSGSGTSGGSGASDAGGGGGGYFGGGGGASNVAANIQIGNASGGAAGGGGGLSYGPVGFSNSSGSALATTYPSIYPGFAVGDGYVQIRWG